MTTQGSSLRNSRFSLLLLEDGEVLLTDISAKYDFDSEKDEQVDKNGFENARHNFSHISSSLAKGRFKIGTKNIFYDSEDWRYPILRIPLSSISNVHLRSEAPHEGRDGDRRNSLPRSTVLKKATSVVLSAEKMFFMRQTGTDHPYIEVRQKGRHIFTPAYIEAGVLLREVELLAEITSIVSRREREKQLRELVQQREVRVPFDITVLEYGAEETALMDSSASAVYTMSRTPGRFRITHQNLYFMSIHCDSSHNLERIRISSIASIRRLRHGCRDAALEVGYRKVEGHSSQEVFATLMVSFKSMQLREKAIGLLLEVLEHQVETFDRASLEKVVALWREGQLSNFDYLIFLNLAAGRSFNDLSQYPVFPWVLKDYTSEVLDLSKETVFRDLSLPVGALNVDRLNVFKQRYNEMGSPRFFYGTHYSAPAYTINYLVRAAPAAMLRLQNGKFDTPDRLFHSIENTWRGVLTNQGDVKELIPEFFVLDYSSGNSSGIVPASSSPGEFLDNVLGLNLGTRQDGKKVGDVELPLWAEGSSEIFVRKNREALESDHVSSHLHKWIDLVFGVKSQDAEACNIFYTDVAIPSVMDSESTSKLTEEEIVQIETVYLEFGRTPQRLFGHPHPPRFGDDQDIFVDEENGETLKEKERDAIPVPVQTCSEHGELTSMKNSTVSRSSTFEGSSESSSGSLNFSESRSIFSLASGPRRTTWGSHSRRRDSVLQGASDHVFVSFEPAFLETEHNESDELAEPAFSQLELGDCSFGTEIIDMTLAENVSTRSNTNDEFFSNDVDTPAICTVWSDGYIKVHSENKILRSKYVGDACSVVYVHPKLLVYGTRNGSIGIYNMSTGRNNTMESIAHEAEVSAVEYVKDYEVLISGSKDASIKVWQFNRTSGVDFSIRLLQELDAESGIEDMSTIMERVRSVRTADRKNALPPRAHLLVATTTLDGDVLAWELDIAKSNQEYLEPIWRANPSKVTGRDSNVSPRRSRTLTWLYQGKRRRPAVASVHIGEKCLRIWKLPQDGMVSAEVFLQDGGAQCITSCSESRTVLVGGANGRITEYDGTGLCLGGIVSGSKEVRHVLLPKVGGRIYVFSGRCEAVRINR